MAWTWSAKQTATQLTGITSTEQFFDLTPQMKPGETADCQVIADFPGTPTNDAIFNVYGTLDDTAERWDDTPIVTFTVSNAIDPNARSFKVTGLYKFRVGVRSDGGDTLVSADFSYRLDDGPA